MKIDPARLRDIQDRFEQELPQFKKVLRSRLRRLGEEAREEAVAESLAICWRDYLNLHLKGRNPGPLVNKIAEFAAKSVLCGARLIGEHTVKDVMSPTCRHRHGHTVQSTPQSDDEETAPEVLEALHAREASPADQATFNVDYQDWLAGLAPKERKVASQFASGLNTVEVGERHGFTGGWGSLMRSRLRADWEEKGR